MKQEPLILRMHMSSPSIFLVGYELFVCLVFIVVYYFCLSSFCVLYLMLLMSLDCTLFLVPSVFSNVYIK